jgi:hypothetical protein
MRTFHSLFLEYFHISSCTLVGTSIALFWWKHCFYYSVRINPELDNFESWPAVFKQAIEIQTVGVPENVPPQHTRSHILFFLKGGHTYLKASRSILVASTAHTTVHNGQF